MGNRFSPGGCKCCGCVADALNACACGCPTPTPKSLFTGDDNGTHTLVWQSGTPTNWTCTVTIMEDVWVRNPSTGVCTNSTTSFNYTITLSCQATTWTLTIGWQMMNCVVVTTNIPHYSNGTGAGTFLANASATIPFNCDLSSGLTFTLPTIRTFFGVDFAVPGGGGSITVMP